MKILIDIGHPAHVHLYKNFISEMKSKGHSVLVTVKNIPSAKKLLENLKIDYIEVGVKSDSISGKLLAQLKFDFQQFWIVNKYKIDIGLGTSITNAHVSKLSRMKSIILDDDDDEVQPLFVKFAHPFCDSLLSPDVLKNKRKKKDTIYYSGYHELTYLHPKRFTPDPLVLDLLGLLKNEKYFILRFNVFKAHHDTGAKGLSIEQKLKLINCLKLHGKIFITTERDIEPELAEYQLRISPEKVHSLLYYATMFIGDSQTMTSEAAVLGTPSIRLNSFVGRISYLEEEEHKYGLTFGFKPDRFDDMIKKVYELLDHPNLKNEWQQRRQQMLSDKIDVTAFMVWFVENYPRSIRIMKKNPDYQFNFR